jgi:hypothetical protein
LFVQLGAMFIPGLRSILGLAPVGLVDGMVIGGAALLPLLVNEATKQAPEIGEQTASVSEIYDP